MVLVSPLVLGFVVACGLTQAAQQNPPVFRSATDTIPFEFSASRSIFGIRRPLRGLKVEDLRLSLEGTELVPTEVREFKPGSYIVNFVPPDEYRDGKPHEVQLIIRKFPTFKRTITMPAVHGGAGE
jgi:hypothetical protein